MPIRRHRSRLVMSALLGIAAFVGLGWAWAGAPAVSGPVPQAAVVAGAADVAAALSEPQADASGARLGRAELVARRSTTPLPLVPDAGLASPGGAPPLGLLSGYRWPLHAPRLTLPFGPTPWGSRIVDGESFHDGMDLATFCGDRIMAAHDGVVLAAGRRYDEMMGWVGDLTPYYRRLDAKKRWSTLPIVVVIDDGNGYRSVYAHFSKVVVRPGQAVLAGSLLGFEGMTGRASGCHLHYGLFSPWEDALFAIDPAVVKRMKVPAAEIARVDPLLVLPSRRPPSGAAANPIRAAGPSRGAIPAR